MGGLDLNTNEATKDNTLFVPGQACSKWLAPTPNATILGCQACLNQKIYLFYNDNKEVWGWIYDPTTDSWSDRITTSKFDHFQQPCATLNGLVWFYSKSRPEFYNPVSNTWTAVKGPGSKAHGVVTRI